MLSRKTVLQLDFNKIIPMPESLHISSGTESALALLCLKNEGIGDFALYNWVKEAGYKTPQELCKHFAYEYSAMVKLGEQIEENRRKYGAASWYEWSIQNWGTKWNATDVTVKYGRNGLARQERAIIKFRTAWNPPVPVVRELSKMFPKHRFTMRYYERGMEFKGVVKAYAGGCTDERTGGYRGNRGG